VACISHFCRSQMMCFAAPADWPKLKIVHCGVDPAEFPVVEHRGFGNRLLFVGRLAGVKGVPVLLEALARVRNERPNVVLRIAGDGPERAAVEALAGRLGLAQNVQFLGYQTQTQVRELLRETDVFVMASFAEGVPVVLMEAMASGVPVVSTNIAGVPELVEDNVSGRLVPPGDAESLAAHVSALLSDPEMRARFGAAGRAKVEREFNLPAEAARLRHVLERTLGGHGNDVPTRPEAIIGVDRAKISHGMADEPVVKCA
jgi:colanic acid/amylovoran biosynthesis glycosyltransferase